MPQEKSQSSFINNAIGINDQGVFLTDSESTILQVNKAFTQITGFSPDDVLGETPSIWRSGKHCPSFYQAMRLKVEQKGIWQGEIWNKNKQGLLYSSWLTVNALKDATGKVSHYLAVFNDLSFRTKAQWPELENNELIGDYNFLTDLPSQSFALHQLQQTIIEADDNDAEFSLLLIDMNQERIDCNGADSLVKSEYNAMGIDKSIDNIIQRLKAEIPVQYTFACWEKKRLMVLMPDSGSLASTSLATRLISAFLRPELNRSSCRLSSNLSSTSPLEPNGEQVINIGIAIYPADAQTADRMLDCASEALKQAKTKGQNDYCFYDLTS